MGASLPFLVCSVDKLEERSVNKSQWQTPWHFTIIENTLIQAKISPTAKAVYLALAMRADRDGSCWPSFKTISEDANVSRPTAMKAVKELEANGFLEVVKRPSEIGDADSNLYILKNYQQFRGGKESLLPRQESYPPVVKNFDQGGKESLPELYPSNQSQINDRRPSSKKTRSEERKRLYDGIDE